MSRILPATREYMVHMEWSGRYLAISAPIWSGDFRLIRSDLDKFADDWCSPGVHPIPPAFGGYTGKPGLRPFNSFAILTYV